MNIKNLKKDFLWYSIGAAIPMILNFIKTPIFTRYYTPADFGNLIIINTTYSYINLFVFSWLLSCIWRYYIREKNNKELNKFYTNTVLLFFIGLILITIITMVWFFLTHEPIIKKLIIANFINLINTTITSLYLITIRLDGKSLIYNFYTIIVSILSFLLLFILTFVFKNSIESMLNCSNIVNGIFIIYIIYKINKNYRFKKDFVSKDLIKEFVKYGFATVFFNMSSLLLTSGDRYVIQYFYSTDNVGIYNQIYNLSKISIVAIYNIFFNIINPYLFKTFEEDMKNEDEFYKYILLYILCILPLTVYFSIYSKQIADILLGEKFRIGYRMMPYVMISSFICGLSVMHEARMKFKNKLKNISINLISASLINLILNLLIIPTLGYEWAARTTLVAYIILYLMDLYSDFSIKREDYYIFEDKIKLLISVVIILSLQLFLHYLLSYNVKYCNTIPYSIIEGFIFITIYVAFVYRKLKDNR